MGTYQGRHALIFAAAPETDYGYIRAFLREHPDALRCVCGRRPRHARALGLHPDFMISDRDSMTDVEGTDIVLLKPEKDDTDSQSCLREVFRRGCREATLVCATGGRIDHMRQISRCLRKQRTARRPPDHLDPYNRVELHQGGRQEFIMPETFTYFSVVPMDAVLEGVTIENAKYELTNGTVTRVGMISTSNEAKPNSRFAVTIERGTALIIFSRDRVL